MKKETVKKLNDILDIADDIIDIEEPEISQDIETEKNDVVDDYEFSRDQYHNLIGREVNLRRSDDSGFSNNPNIGMSQPNYNECTFTIEQDDTLIIPITLIYL